MRWRRRAAWLFGTGIVLLVASLGMLLWLYLMDARATVSPDPNAVGLEDRFALGSVDDSSDSSDPQDDGFVNVDWKYWKEVNPDIIAWVNVEGTRINHPIMHAPVDDPTYYLHHDIYRNYSVYGVPYLDADYAENGLPTFNAIIYGHHMDNGTMFSDFAAYSDADYAREHSTICIQTPAGRQRLRVSNVNIIDGDTTAKAVQFADEEAFRAWFQEQQAGAQVVLDEEDSEKNDATNDDTNSETGSNMKEEMDRPPFTITFCTCSYHRFNNERTLVICVPESA